MGTNLAFTLRGPVHGALVSLSCCVAGYCCWLLKQKKSGTGVCTEIYSEVLFIFIPVNIVVHAISPILRT